MDRVIVERVIESVNKAEVIIKSGKERKQFVLDSVIGIYPEANTVVLGYIIDTIVGVSKAVTPLLINLKELDDDDCICCLPWGSK